MADIITFEDKLRISKAKLAAITKKRRILAFQRMFQCSRCMLKCEKCGIQISPSSEQGIETPKSVPGKKLQLVLPPDQVPEDGTKTTVVANEQKIPYRFCDACAAEYMDYIEQLKGNNDPDCYWHNDLWLEMWRKWLDYQSVVDRYLKSKEFKRVLEELKENISGE